MTLIELKSELIKEIENTDNPDNLEIIKIFLNNLNSEPPVLSEWQIKRIEESEKQIERGEFYTEEEADEQVEDWLKSKNA